MTLAELDNICADVIAAVILRDRRRIAAEWPEWWRLTGTRLVPSAMFVRLASRR